jgi:CO/xanthine dehydrogenase FAD-binding subunit
MILLDFDYERADALEDAVALLGSLGSDARLIAGGTDLLPNVRSGLVQPGVLVGLGAIAPKPPRLLPDGSVWLDALSRLADLQASDLLATHAPMLVAAAHAVGGNQIRQMGTLGGNLCQETRCLQYNQSHDYQFAAPCYKRGGDCCYPFPQNKRGTCWSVHMSDVAPALIAQGAQLEILGPGGARRIDVEALYSGDGMTPIRLGEAELIRAVIVPAPPPRSGWGFHKSTVRGGLEFGMAVMAVVLRLADDGTCADARISIGAVRERPVRSLAAERELVGATLDENRLARAAGEAAREVSPLPHHGFTKRALVDNMRVHLKRTLALALERASAAGLTEAGEG